MGLKRKIKRPPHLPKTKVHDWGIEEILQKIERALEILARRY